MRLPSARVCELSVITSAENGAFFTPARSIPPPGSPPGPPGPGGPSKPMRPRPPRPGGGPCANATAASEIRATIVIRIVIPLLPAKRLIQETHGARHAVRAEHYIGFPQFFRAIGADVEAQRNHRTARQLHADQVDLVSIGGFTGGKPSRIGQRNKTVGIGLRLQHGQL